MGVLGFHSVSEATKQESEELQEFLRQTVVSD